MIAENTVWYLRRSRFFERVTEDVLHNCLSYFTVTRRPDRTQLFVQGAAAGTVYFLKEGRVRLSRVTESGKAITIAILGPGDVFGEEGLFEAAERKTAATVIDDALVCTASATNLVALMHREPLLAMNVARYLQEQRDEAVSAIEDITFLKVPERILKLFERLAHDYGVTERDGVRIDLRLTHADIAALVGSTRETVSLDLSKLARDGRILLRDHAFLLPSAVLGNR